MVPDDETLRAMLAAAAGGRVSITPMWRDGPPVLMSGSAADLAAAELTVHAPALAAEVLRLRETNKALGPSLAAARADFHAMEEAFYAMQARAEKAEAERDALRAAVRDFLDTPAPCYGVALQAVVDALGGDQ